jgi:hypothetical protein
MPGEGSLDPNDGFISQALGHRAALDLLHLRLPWWDPYEGTGAPLAAGMTSAAFFPPTLLNAISNGLIYERVLLELVAGVSLYLLLRRLSLRRVACVPAAIAFALNGTFAWFAITPINAVAVFPALLLGVEVAYARSTAGRCGGWWLLAVAGALSVYAGFPEVAYINTLFALCWCGWRCGRLRGRTLRAFVGKLAAGATVGTLLSAPLLVPFAEYLPQGMLGSHSNGLAAATYLSAPALSQLVLPYVYGPVFAFGDARLMLTTIWFDVGGFLSTSLLLFALFGLCSRGRRGLRLVLLAWIMLALARIYREPPLLGEILGLVPGMSRVQFFRHGFPSVELAMVVLAALGLDEMAGPRPSRRRTAVVAGLSLGVVALATVEARPLAHRLGSDFYRDPYFWGSVGWGAAIVLAGAAGALFVRSPRARALSVALLVTADAVVLFALPQGSAPRSVHLDLAPVEFLQRHLGTSRVFTLGPLQPNYGTYFGLAELNINELPIPTVFADYVHTRLDQAVDPSALVGNLGGARSVSAPSPVRELLRNVDGYREAAVAYVLVPVGQTLPSNTFELVFRSPSTWIYRLAEANPYVTAPGCTIETRSRNAFEVACAHRSGLTRRETYFPGWRATIDGRAAHLERVDGVFQSLTVPAGTHRIAFAYAPPYVEFAYAALALGCAWLLLEVVRRLRTQPRPSMNMRRIGIQRRLSRSSARRNTVG